MFQVVPSRIYKYKHHFNNQLQTLSFQLYQNLKGKILVHICITLI